MNGSLAVAWGGPALSWRHSGESHATAINFRVRSTVPDLPAYQTALKTFRRHVTTFYHCWMQILNERLWILELLFQEQFQLFQRHFITHKPKQYWNCFISKYYRGISWRTNLPNHLNLSKILSHIGQQPPGAYFILMWSIYFIYWPHH